MKNKFKKWVVVTIIVIGIIVTLSNIIMAATQPTPSRQFFGTPYQMPMSDRFYGEW